VKILATYPDDRVRDRSRCLGLIREALDDGVAPDDLQRAVQSYATETAGYTRSKVSYSDNWFKMQKWAPKLEKLAADRRRAMSANSENLSRLVGWIADRHPLCRHITHKQAKDLVAAGLVTAQQVADAGMQI